ncbi:MAG: hypothetical protein LBB76_13105, partial [Azoarcus sp.]|nr:hypothetical protein [Azoarcus sp.]
MKLLTATEKRAIARDWKNALQFYEVPKSMWLVKRNGPILTGVYLARSDGGTRYSPEFYIHPLWRKFPCVSLDCQKPLMLPNGVRDAFTYLGHQSKFDEIIERFRHQCPYAFVDQISSTILEDILNHNIATSEIWPVESFMDSVLCAVYCNKLEEVEDRIDKCKRVL